MKHPFIKRPSDSDRLFRRYLPENAVFWMVLLLLSIGCITSLYEKSIQSTDASSGVFAASTTGSNVNAKNNHSYKVKERNLPIYCVETDKPQVALSFDAAWGNQDTMQIMEILDKYNVKVTFFMTGGWVEKHPEDVKYIVSQGHDLGNHSENHKNMSQLGENEIQMEIQTVHEKVKNLTGFNMTLFRPPYGDYDNKVIETSDSMGYYPVQWDVDTLVMGLKERFSPEFYEKHI